MTNLPFESNGNSARSADVDAYEPHWMPQFSDRLPVSENVFSLARPLWGKPYAEWAMLLGDDLVSEHPEIARDHEAEWVAAILWATALEANMKRDDLLWAHVVDDISQATGVPAECAGQRFEQLRELGLTRPINEPDWWRLDETTHE